jgi:hypothetical protein
MEYDLLSSLDGKIVDMPDSKSCAKSEEVQLLFMA